MRRLLKAAAAWTTVLWWLHAGVDATVRKPKGGHTRPRIMISKLFLGKQHSRQQRRRKLRTTLPAEEDINIWSKNFFKDNRHQEHIEQTDGGNENIGVLEKKTELLHDKQTPGANNDTETRQQEANTEEIGSASMLPLEKTGQHDESAGARTVAIPLTLNAKLKTNRVHHKGKEENLQATDRHFHSYSYDSHSHSSDDWYSYSSVDSYTYIDVSDASVYFSPDYYSGYYYSSDYYYPGKGKKHKGKSKYYKKGKKGKHKKKGKKHKHKDKYYYYYKSKKKGKGYYAYTDSSSYYKYKSKKHKGSYWYTEYPHSPSSSKGKGSTPRPTAAPHPQPRPPTRRPTNRPPSPTTSRPTPTPPPSENLARVEANPFGLLYDLPRLAGIPRVSDYDGVHNYTDEWLETVMIQAYGRRLINVDTRDTANVYSFGDPVQINYRTTALFPSGETDIPSQTDLDLVVTAAFTGRNLEYYLDGIAGLGEPNVFRQTTEVTFTTDVVERRQRADASGISTLGTVGILVGAIGSFGVVLAVLAGIYRRRQNAEGKFDGQRQSENGSKTCLATEFDETTAFNDERTVNFRDDRTVVYSDHGSGSSGQYDESSGGRSSLRMTLNG